MGDESSRSLGLEAKGTTHISRVFEVERNRMLLAGCLGPVGKIRCPSSCRSEPRKEDLAFSFLIGARRRTDFLLTILGDDIAEQRMLAWRPEPGELVPTTRWPRWPSDRTEVRCSAMARLRVTRSTGDGRLGRPPRDAEFRTNGACVATVPYHRPSELPLGRWCVVAASLDGGSAIVSSLAGV